MTELPKGPWFVGSLPPPTWRYICDADGNVIASVAEWDESGNLVQEFGGTEQAEAVARAIAAIPETIAEINDLRAENESLRTEIAELRKIAGYVNRESYYRSRDAIRTFFAKTHKEKRE